MTAAPPGTPSRGISSWRTPLVVAAVWAGLYGWRALTSHASLGTNAYDLSVFDYALWSLVHGQPAQVPFMGHSIFSHHFMPVLGLLAPLYALWQAPPSLIVLQTMASAAAGVALWRLARLLGVRAWQALTLMLVFLLCRRGHGAFVSYFYPESLQPLCIFILVLAWISQRWRLFWIATLLLLMTKEDAAIYVAAFGAVQWFVSRAQRRRATVVTGVAVLWLGLAAGVAIPASRALEGLPTANPFIESRLGSPEGSVGPGGSGARARGRAAASTVTGLLATAGFLPLASAWALVAAPGVALSLLVRPGTGQAAIIGHYAWPILPWLFVAAADTVRRFDQRWPRATAGWMAVLLLVTVADAPVIRYATRTRVDRQALDVRSRLPAPVPRMMAQPNVIPHLAHASDIQALGYPVMAVPPDLVVMTDVGNLWPFTLEELTAMKAAYAADPRYEQIEDGHLWVFRRIKRP
jgi:uncharacterized membrane protein